MKTKKVKVILSLLMVVLLAWTFSSCSKSDSTPAVVTTSLTDQITVATNLLATTTEGTAAGQYPHGSQATLLTAITAAEAVLNATNPKPTQADITNATANLAAAVTAYQAAVVVAIAPENLMGQWTFDELTTAAVGTNVKDYSGNSRNGTITAGHSYYSSGAGLPWPGYTVTTNVPTQTADRYGSANKALHFEGGANVEIPYNSGLNPQQITISLWANADSLPGNPGKYYANNYLVSMNLWYTYKLQIQDTPRPFFSTRVAGLNSPPLGTQADSIGYDRDMNVGKVSPLSKWHHYVVTFGGGHEVFYVDGFLVYDWGSNNDGVPGTIVSIAATPVNLVIGQALPTSKYSSDPNSKYYPQPWVGCFIGAIDEVRIYNTVLSPAQVTSIYTAEKP